MEVEDQVAQQSTANNLLQLAISATNKQTNEDQIKILLTTLTQQALKGTIKWDKNLLITINNAISTIDALISKQLAAIMSSNEFKDIESSWRGLNYLVMNSETSTSLKIKVLNATKNELHKDFSKAAEFDQSQMFKKIYENEFGTPGGEPFGLLVGDYYFENNPEDLDLLGQISNVAAAAFSPYLGSIGASLFGLDSWSDLSKPRDLAKIFDSVEYAKWRSFRNSDDSRFVCLAMPRVLARLPYGKETSSIEDFDFEETALDEKGHTKQLNHQDYCWMNAAYVLAVTLTGAYSKYGWCTAIRGAEGGGKVEGLPLHVFRSDDGDMDSQCPTEIGITDRREAELSKLGFLPLCHYKSTDYAVFFGAQSAQAAKVYNTADATANAAISARLPYIMATSRFAHYLKIMARDKIGSFLEASDVEKWLNNWIINYVDGNPDSGQEMKSKYPLAEAKIQVKAIPGKPGSYQAIAWLKPWLQMEELSTSLRMVANIPKLGGGEQSKKGG